jgi:Retrotransposon gag protein
MDKNPIQTETLAEDLYTRSSLAGIEEEVDPSQDRTHYLPTTIQPVSINPARIRSSQPGAKGSTIAATTNVDVNKLVNSALKIDGSLKGKVPESFNGDRTKMQKFMNAFDLFWMNNEDNSHMKNLYKRCTYFLGLLEGTKVDEWVVKQTNSLRKRTTQPVNKIAKGDEALWEDLKNDFTNAFSHTGRIEQARMDLGKLEMEGDQIDEYIARFETLLDKAEIPCTEVGAIQKFKDGSRRVSFPRSFREINGLPLLTNGKRMPNEKSVVWPLTENPLEIKGITTSVINKPSGVPSHNNSNRARSAMKLFQWKLMRPNSSKIRNEKKRMPNSAKKGIASNVKNKAI